MGDSESPKETQTVNASVLSSGLIKIRLTRLGALENAEAIERACASAEKVLDTAAGRLEREPDANAAAITAVAAGYLALAKFRREAQS